MRNLGAVLLIGLMVFTLVEVINSDGRERFGLPRLAWILLIVLVPPVGSIVWLVVSRSRRAAESPAANGWGRTVAAAGPTAPDDDPEFLWLLDQKRRQAERDARPDDRDQSPE